MLLVWSGCRKWVTVLYRRCVCYVGQCGWTGGSYKDDPLSPIPPNTTAASVDHVSVDYDDDDDDSDDLFLCFIPVSDKPVSQGESNTTGRQPSMLLLLGLQ